MLLINELKDNIINLNDLQTHYEFDVISKSDDGGYKQFGIEIVSNESIFVKAFDLNSISIDIDIPNILEEEIIVLKNTLNERVEIKVIPNEHNIMDKSYKFKITKKKFEDDGSIKVKILSTINNEELGWKCTYDGKPMNYIITPRSNEGSCFVEIKPNSQVFNNFESVIIFTQNESNNEIRLMVYNTPEGIKKKVD